MSETFDTFTVEEAAIKTYAFFNIDGAYDTGFFGGEETAPKSFDGYTRWKLLRITCIEIIKGKHTPSFMKFVFHGNREEFSDIPEYADIKALLFIIRYDSNGLTITTGTSMNSFSLDFSIDRLWDEAVKKLLTARNVDYEEL